MPAPLIWHVTELALWQDAVRTGVYTHSTRGRSLAEEGFIHASWPEQVSALARRLYPEHPEDLVILEIDVARVEAAGIEVEVEIEPHPGGGDTAQGYPHILGAPPVDAVVRIRRTRWIGAEFVVVA